MRKLLVLAALAAFPMYAQFSTAKRIVRGASLPTRCAVGDVFYKTAATAGQYNCTAANTWTLVEAGAGTGDVTAASNIGKGQVAVGNDGAKAIEPSTLDAAVTKMTKGVPSAATAGTDYLAPVATNPQTGTTYAILTGDRNKLVTLTNGASIAVSIAAAGSTGFANGWETTVLNAGAGTATITPATSTIEGVSTLVLTTGQAAKVWSNGTNYRVARLGKVAAATLADSATGNAGTATALAANGANCSAGNAPLGVDASGAVESCFAVQAALTGPMTQAVANSVDNSVSVGVGTSGTAFEKTPVTIDPATGAIAGAASISTGDGTVAGEDILLELTANGSNYRSWHVPDALTASLKFVLPDANPGAGDVMQFAAPSASESAITFRAVAEAATGSTIVIRDSGGNVIVASEAYNATNWDADTAAPQKDAVRDQIETLAPKASPVFTTQITIPNDAAPTIDAVGEMAVDTNLWAASHGAIITYDGTAAVAVVAATASDVPTNGQVPTWNTGGTITWETPGGTGTVTVAGAGNLTSTALVTGGGTQVVQTPSATTTLNASGNLAVAAGGSLGSADTGAPKLTFATNKMTANQPVYLGVASNQLVTGTTTNLTTVTFPASSGAVTVTMPNTTSTVCTTAVCAPIADPVFTGSLQLPNGGPTIDAAGEIGVDTTTDQLQFYGAAKRALPSIMSFSFVIMAPVATDDILLMKAPYGMTILTVKGVLIGSTNVIGHLMECDAAGANCATVDSTADITFNGGEDADDGTLSNPSIDAGDWIQWNTTSVSATPTALTVTVTYRAVAD